MTIIATERGAEAERRKNATTGKRKSGGSSTGADDEAPSREEIEIRLLEAQWRLADAETEQDYSLCSKLQRDVKDLEVKWLECSCKSPFLNAC